MGAIPSDGYHIVELFRASGQLANCGRAAQVKVYIKRPYGCLMVTITDEGNIILDSQDGDGETLETSYIDPDEFVSDGEADPDDDEDEELEANAAEQFCKLTPPTLKEDEDDE